MLIYKIFLSEEWDTLRDLGSTEGSPDDLRDGFIHLSTAAQAPGTAATHFAGREGLWLAAVDTDRLGPDLRWEPSRGSHLFPHLYRPLRLDDVEWAKPLPMREGVHVFPDDMA